MITIAIANQKGGCGKTTTAINLAACLGRAGSRVLLIDLDPQGHTSLGLGRKHEDGAGLYEVFTHDVLLPDTILPEVTGGLDLIPATVSLAAAELLLAGLPRRERQLTTHLESLSGEYDFTIIDCPPTLGLLSFNALRAANLVLIPIEMSVFSLDGVDRLHETINLLTEKYGLDIAIRLLPTMVDYRCCFTRDTLDMIHEGFSDTALPVAIHYTVRLKEAAARGLPIIDHAPDSPASLDYQALAREILRLYNWNAPAEGVSPPLGTQRFRPQFPPAADPRSSRTASGSGRPARLHRITLSFMDTLHRDIKIAGDFNDWIPDADVETKRTGGTLRKILYLQPGTYQYRLIMNGRWCEDPTNPRCVRNEIGELHSVLEVVEDRQPITA